jgi:hypothetical protein
VTEGNVKEVRVPDAPSCPAPAVIVTRLNEVLLEPFTNAAMLESPALVAD